MFNTKINIKMYWFTHTRKKAGARVGQEKK